MNFERWLLKKVGEKTPVGDLAYDYQACIDVFGAMDIEETFKIHSPCSRAVEAYKLAKEQYQSDLLD